MSVRVGDSSRRSEEIVKKVKNSAFKFDYYYLFRKCSLNCTHAYALCELELACMKMAHTQNRSPGAIQACTNSDTLIDKPTNRFT